MTVKRDPSRDACDTAWHMAGAKQMITSTTSVTPEKPAAWLKLKEEGSPGNSQRLLMMSMLAVVFGF